MARELGYVSPLLSNLAVDFSSKVREGLIGSRLFPRVLVAKPSGKYATFDKESVYRVPDTTMAGERSQANEFHTSGKMEKYATEPHGLKSFIDKAELDFMEGPFKLWERRKVESLVTALEVAQEKRIADVFLNLDKRSASPATKWAGGAGDPVKDINDGIKECLFRPNTMVLSEGVYDALEYHPKLIAKLGEANLIKKVDDVNLAKLFRIDKVIIAKGKADFGKPKEDKSVNPQSIWGDSVVLTYVDSGWDRPCGGKTVAVRYPEADNAGYVVRSWREEDGGILGGEYVQVAHDVDELIICAELNYTLKSVLA